MDEEDFLAAVEADNANLPVEEPSEAKVEETPPAPIEEAPAPVEAETPPPVEPALTVPVPKPDGQFAPIGALLDERDKRKALEAELAQLRASQPQQQPQQIPDVFEDPDGFAAYQAQAAQTATLNAKLDISEEMARDKFGDELVDQARDWALQQAQTRPGFYQELIQQRNPYRYAVEQFRREQIASQVTLSDFEQFQAWKAAQAQLQAPAPPGAAAPPDTSRQAPPRSLASAPSAGGVLTEVEQSEDEIFAEVIPKR